MAALEDIKQIMQAAADKSVAQASQQFFKTGKGEYGEGDHFLGIRVPRQRAIAKEYYSHLSLDAIEKLLCSPWHEERLTALFILIRLFNEGDENRKNEIANIYLRNLSHVNNWDLVDSSAPYILGSWLSNNIYKLPLLKKLAVSDNLWERRVSILATFFDIKHDNSETSFIIIDILKADKEDLIQKAIGWALREIGKVIDRKLLLDYLDVNATNLPRTTLRYAIEHLPIKQRKHYLAQK